MVYVCSVWTHPRALYCVESEEAELVLNEKSLCVKLDGTLAPVSLSDVYWKTLLSSGWFTARAHIPRQPRPLHYHKPHLIPCFCVDIEWVRASREGGRELATGEAELSATLAGVQPLLFRRGGVRGFWSPVMSVRMGEDMYALSSFSLGRVPKDSSIPFPERPFDLRGDWSAGSSTRTRFKLVD
jgi:hypothetical protein